MGPAGFLIADDGEIGARNQLGLAAREPEWVTLSRGLETDVTDATGAPVDSAGQPSSSRLPCRVRWRGPAGPSDDPRQPPPHRPNAYTTVGLSPCCVKTAAAATGSAETEHSRSPVDRPGRGRRAGPAGRRLAAVPPGGAP